MKQGTKMIYDALDNLQASPKVVELSEKIAELDEAVMQRMERDRKEMVRLIMALQAKDEKIALYEQALEVACEEVEHQLILPEERYKSCILRHFTDPQNDCDNDCGVCLKNYFLAKGQDRIDMQKACADEEEGRKRMDVEDMEKEMKG